MTHIIKFAFIALFTFVFCQAKAQTEKKTVRPAQITFVYPLGTNGLAASKTINNFSLNMLWGISAGVMGAEIGGLGNLTHGPVIGFQMGGLGNVSSGPMVGAQIGGLINTSSSIRGAQIGGALNISSEKIEDSEIAPQSNGAQISGLMNVNTTEIQGAQIAGIMNIQTDDFKGLQTAGIVNYAQGDVQGVQVAGAVNRAATVSGWQIGLINIADTIKKGIPLGVVNIVKDGYRAVEIESNESFYVNVNYKMGIERFYTIFSVGFEAQGGKNFWAPGIGFGSSFLLSQRLGMNIDAISYQVNEGEWWTNELNQLSKLKINASYQFAPHLTVYGGISMNAFVTEVKNAEGHSSEFNIPKSFYKDDEGKTHVYLYPGLNIGIRF